MKKRRSLPAQPLGRNGECPFSSLPDSRAQVRFRPIADISEQWNKRLVFRSKALWLFTPLAVASTQAQASGPPMVWFASGDAHLDGQSEAMLDYAAGWLRSARAEKIIIEAGADCVGSATSNLLLSRRRGEAVKAALVGRGFRSGQIEVRAFGESRPIVETADGVAERQNRYAMLVIETQAEARQ
jgi:outer membrane protein OmpA-like peptidoglycan-associated protein